MFGAGRRRRGEGGEGGGNVNDGYKEGAGLRAWREGEETFP